MYCTEDLNDLEAYNYGKTTNIRHKGRNLYLLEKPYACMVDDAIVARAKAEDYAGSIYELIWEISEEDLPYIEDVSNWETYDVELLFEN